MSWTTEPTANPEVHGIDALAVLYDGHLLDTVRRGAGVYATRWCNGRTWRKYDSATEAVDACKADWQPMIDANGAAGRPPLFQPAAIYGTGAMSHAYDRRTA